MSSFWNSYQGKTNRNQLIVVTGSKKLHQAKVQIQVQVQSLNSKKIKMFIATVLPCLIHTSEEAFPLVEVTVSGIIYIKNIYTHTHAYINVHIHTLFLFLSLLPCHSLDIARGQPLAQFCIFKYCVTPIYLVPNKYNLSIVPWT